MTDLIAAERAILRVVPPARAADLADLLRILALSLEDADQAG